MTEVEQVAAVPIVTAEVAPVPADLPPLPPGPPPPLPHQDQLVVDNPDNINVQADKVVAKVAEETREEPVKHVKRAGVDNTEKVKRVRVREEGEVSELETF